MSPLRPIARRALATQSDERLVRLLREGHEPAFEEMVRRYRAPLVAFATAIVSHDGAEDVVQASLEKAHRALLGDSRDVALRPWLFTIVRNGALNTVRAEPQADELVVAAATVPGPSELAEQHEDLERLVEAICALPAAQRQALVRRELEGVGHGEIAAQLGTTSTAVRGLIFRARTSLRDAVGAVLPLPILRVLLSEGPAAAGGASAGAGAALLGGAGAKGGTAIAAAIVALGTGIAIDQGRGSSGAGRDDPAIAVEASSRGGSSGSDEAGSGDGGADESDGAGSRVPGSGSSGGDRGSGDDSSGPGPGSGEGDGGDRGGPGGERTPGDDHGGGPGPSGSGGDGDGPSDSGGSDSSGSGDGSSDSSGSGSSGSSGSGSEGSPPDGSIPPPDDSGPGSSGSSDDGGGSSGRSGEGSGSGDDGFE